MDIKGRIALITGAARGIGAAIARILAEHGATVVIADVNYEEATKFASRLRKNGYIAKEIKVDVSNEESVSEMTKNIVKTFDRIDFLVNNAGINNNVPVTELKIEDWNRIIDVNLKGVHLCSQSILKEMIKNGFGKIVNIASLAGQIGGLKVGADYTSAKAGVIGLTKSYAKFCTKYRINVNAVSPGFIETEMTKGRDDPRSVPIGRLGTPEDVAYAVYFLLSPMSDYITGATIDVNGGMFMR